MRFIVFAVCCTAAAALAVSASGSVRADGHTLCVGSGAGCHPTLQAAVAAAHDGDTIRLGAGTFAGNVTIDKSVDVVGAGPAATTIRGGGPVLTIGTLGAVVEPTVDVSRVTITGGVSTSSRECGPSCAVGYLTATALGGGVEVPPSAAGTGATVTISDSVISGNRASPTSTVPSVRAICPGNVHCSFALGGGGGIDNWGTMTLVRSTVTDNEVSGAVSDADGGGILNMAGTLTLMNSDVTGNRALATPPYGRFAEGGGIFAAKGSVLTLRDSAVSANSAELTSSFPRPYPLQGGGTDSNAHGGGLHLGDGGSATIENSRLDGNVVSVDDPLGEPIAFDAAVCICGGSPLVLRNSTVSGNHVTARVSDMTDTGPAGNALEFDGSADISNTRITGNTADMTSTSPGGTAGALGAVINFGDDAVISNSVISDNTISATSASGVATAQGAGVVNVGVLSLRNDEITRNSATVTGLSGGARGGGIWNGALFGGPAPQLTLDNTIVMHNTLAGSRGLALEGGGIYTLGFTATLVNGVVAHNVPDDCVGC